MENKLIFDPKNHEYKYNDQILDSVNYVISHYQEPFDGQKIAKIVARRDGKSVKSVFGEWKRIREEGTEIHNLCEDLLNNKEISCDEKYIPKLLAAKQFVEYNIKDNDLKNLRTEMQLYNLHYGIAGTADVVLLDGKNKRICVYDWKTNTKIDTESYNNKRLYNPINHLIDSKYTKYSLQLSMYAYMLNELYKDYTIQELAFVHVKNDGYVKYNSPFMKHEVTSILEDYKKRVKNANSKEE